MTDLPRGTVTFLYHRHRGQYRALDNQGRVAHGHGEFERAAPLFEQALLLWQELGNTRNAADSLHSLGLVVQERGEGSQGLALLEQALALSQKAGDMLGIARSLEGIAGMALVSKQERAAPLLGAAAALREALGAPVPAREREDHDRAAAALRTALGETAFAGAWTAGGALSPEQAVAETLTLPNE